MAEPACNLFRISSSHTSSCINEILGLHEVYISNRVIAQFRIFHEASISLFVILNSRVSLFLHILYVFSLPYHLSEGSGIVCTTFSFGLMVLIIPERSKALYF